MGGIENFLVLRIRAIQGDFGKLEFIDELLDFLVGQLVRFVAFATLPGHPDLLGFEAGRDLFPQNVAGVARLGVVLHSDDNLEKNLVVMAGVLQELRGEAFLNMFWDNTRVIEFLLDSWQQLLFPLLTNIAATTRDRFEWQT
jgi:hypothetical protein